MSQESEESVGLAESSTTSASEIINSITVGIEDKEADVRLDGVEVEHKVEVERKSSREDAKEDLADAKEDSDTENFKDILGNGELTKGVRGNSI